MLRLANFLTKTFLYKSVKVHTSTSAYGIAVSWLFSFMCSWNWGKFKFVSKEVLNTLWILWDKWKYVFLCFYFMFFFFGVRIYMYFFDAIWWEMKTSNRKSLLEFIKSRSKVDQNNLSREIDLRFDHLKKRIWLWIICNITENNCYFWLLTEFIQTQKRYPNSIDKISTVEPP